MDKWYLIVNPAGGSGSVQKKWPEIKATLEKRGFNFEWVFTEYKQHATQLAQHAVDQGYRKIMTLGGDGTNNEVINGLMLQQTVPPTELTYALLPVGTGNDWIKTHNIPRKWQDALSVIEAGYTRLHDVGKVQYETPEGTKNRFFINIAGMAYDAFLVKYIEERNPKGISAFYYYSMILRCLFKYRLKPAKVWIDGQEIEGRYYTVNVGICKYSGGGMQFVPHGDPGSGRLALTVVNEVSKLGVLLATPYFYNGRIVKHSKASFYEAQEIRVNHLDENEPVFVEVDGEYLGYTPVVYRVLPQALRVVVPEGSY